MIKDFLGFGLGVSQLIIGIIALQTLCICLFLIFLHRGMISVIQSGLLELDNKLASAIQNLISGEINLPDAPNPMQALIMELVKQKMQIKPVQEVLIKGNDGKFKGS